MKILPRRKALVVLAVCLALAAPAGYYLRQFCMRVLLGMSDSEAGRFQRDNRAAMLLNQADAARMSAPGKAIKLFQALEREYPDSHEASQAMITLVKMASMGQAPASCLQEAYDRILARQSPLKLEQRNQVLHDLEKLDAARGWPLHWQFICDCAQDAASESDAMPCLTDVLDSVRFSQNDAAARALLLKAARTPELKAIHAPVVALLLQKTEEDQGAAEALRLAGQLARELPGSEAGLEAFRQACDRLKRLKGDPEVLAFIEECRAMPGDGLVQAAARDRLAARYLDRNDVETALSLYCAPVKPGSLPALPAPVLRAAAERMVSAVGRDDVTTVSVLQSLAKAAAERKLYGASRELYSQAAAVCHAPELGAAGEAETAFSESDAMEFWRAYLLRHEGETGRGRDGYESLLARYHQGWQAAQMMYDLAVEDLVRFRLEEAVEWSGKAAQILPKNPAALELRRSCEQSLAADRPLAATAADLQLAVKSATRPEAKAQGLMKIAEVQFQRGRYDEGALALWRVWEQFPESPFAPKAAFRAGEVLSGVPDAVLQAEAGMILGDLVLHNPTDEISSRGLDILQELEGGILPDEVYREEFMSWLSAGKSAVSEIAVPGTAATDMTGAEVNGLAAEDPGEYYESAAEALLREGRANEALDVIALGLQGRVTRAKLKEFLLACKARSDQELPTAAARIVPWADTCAGLQALARMLRWRVVNAEGVEGLCRALQEKAPLSRAAMLARVSEAGEALRRKDFPGARKLLSGLTDPAIPPEIRAPALECAADGSFLQGNYREADKTYREAAGEYIYEEEIPGSGLFGLKKQELSQGAPPEDWEVDGLCVKGYLLLARGERCEGTACLNRALARLDRLPADSEVRDLRTADVRLLLAAAYWAQGDRTLGARQGEMALRHLLKKAEPRRRAELLAFAETVCRSVFQEAPGPLLLTRPNIAVSTLAQAEVDVVRRGSFSEARAEYDEALRKLAPHDVKTVLTVCAGTVQCLVRQQSREGLEHVLFDFRQWAARRLPDEYEGYVWLTAVKRYYATGDFAKALDEVTAYAVLGTDADVLARAQLLAGLIEIQTGHPAAAVRSCEEALAGNSPQEETNTRALVLMGDVWLLEGNPRKAQEAFDVLVKKYPHAQDPHQYKDILDRGEAPKPETNGPTPHRADEPLD